MAYRPDVIDAGKSFLEEVLGHIPEADRATVRTVFEKPEAEDALGVAGTGAKRLSDYSRDKDALVADREQLDQLKADLLETQQKQIVWWNANQAKLEDYNRLKAAGGATVIPVADPTKVVNPPDGFVSKADVDKAIAEVEQGGMGFMLLQNVLTRKHWQAFGEFLDISELVNDPRARKVGLEGLYQEKFQGRYDAKAKGDQEARDKKLVEETESRVRREMGARNIPGGPPEHSVLDHLAPPKEGVQKPSTAEGDVIDRSVALYEDLARREQQQTA